MIVIILLYPQTIYLHCIDMHADYMYLQNFVVHASTTFVQRSSSHLDFVDAFCQIHNVLHELFLSYYILLPTKLMVKYESTKLILMVRILQSSNLKSCAISIHMLAIFLAASTILLGSPHHIDWHLHLASQQQPKCMENNLSKLAIKLPVY